MKVSELSDEALSRWIAEKLEPAPTHEDREWFCGDLPDWIEDEDGDFYRSDGECWICVYRSGDKWEHFQRDVIHDGAMTVMLLEKSPNPHLWRNPDKSWTCDPDFEDEQFANADKLGRSVAEAFALANGWKS